MEYQMVRALRAIEADLHERGVSSAAWCRAARIDRSTWWRYRCERRQPSPRTFDRLVSAACAITGYQIDIEIRIRLGRITMVITDGGKRHDKNE